MQRDQIFQHHPLKMKVDIYWHIFQSFSGRRYVLELWFFILSCCEETIKIFIQIEILVENISRFNTYGKAGICHYVLSFARYKESNKLFVVIIRWLKVTCLNKVFIDTAIEKFKLMRNRSFIKGIFYFLKTILFFDIFKDFIFKFFFIYESFI